MGEQRRDLNDRSARTIVVYAVLAALTVVAPHVLCVKRLFFVLSTAGDARFELFGFCASASLLYVTWVESKRRAQGGFAAILPVLLFCVVGFHLATLVGQFTVRSWDYRCYRAGAVALAHGANPYVGTRYLYPPAPAEALAGGHAIVGALVAKCRIHMTDYEVWGAVFYLYQCAQFFVALFGYLVGNRLHESPRHRAHAPQARA